MVHVARELSPAFNELPFLKLDRSVQIRVQQESCGEKEITAANRREGSQTSSHGGGSTLTRKR